jgi:tripartite-type tricarboxylate transporter receptor subunit TctC
MIKHFLISLTLAVTTVAATAQQTISVIWPVAPSHGTTTLMYPLLEEANRSQSQYNFILEFKPGANFQIALNYMNQQPASRVSMIAPTFVELAYDGKVIEDDYRYLVGLGDFCFAIWNKYSDSERGLAGLRGTGEIVLGNVGWGNSGHLVALEIASKYNLTVKNVVFKSNFEGLVNLAQNGGVTQVQESVKALDSLSARSIVSAKPLAITCSTRRKEMPNVKTMYEQGITTAGPWHLIIANKNMPAETQKSVTDILNRALIALGEDKILELSNLHPIVFQKNKDVEAFYKNKSSAQKALLQKYRSIIDADRGISEKK